MPSSAVRPRRVGSRVVAWVCAGILLAAVFVVVWVGVRGALAAQHLVSAQQRADELVASFDADGALDPDLADRLARDTAAARGLTSDPVWALAAATPWLGPQLDAARAVAESADIVASEALPSLAAQGSLDLRSLLPQGGRVDAAAIAELEQPMAVASEALARSDAALADIRSRDLLAPLAEQVDTYRSLIAGAAEGSDALYRATRLLPGMLGGDGPRTYLLLFQNNAEWRSLGGIPGQVARVTANDGVITLDSISAASDFPQYAESVLPLDEDVASIYEQRPGQWMQDVTQVADFPTAAQLASEMWSRRFGERVDGVFGVDTVALSYLLEATGPITVPTGDSITAENAVPLLLNEVYFRYPVPNDQDAFFAAVAGTVFTSLTSGAAEPAPLLSALGRAGAERRVLAWSADPAEQDVIAGTALAGGLPQSDAGGIEFGVYLNDGTGSKMDYYLDEDTAVGWTQCGAESSVATLTVGVRNDAPPPEQLPEYITGGGIFGVPAGLTRTVVYVYLPEAYQLIDTQLPEGVTTAGGFHDGLQVVILTADLSSGQQVEMTLSAQGPRSGTVTALVTPTVNAAETVMGTGTCD